MTHCLYGNPIKDTTGYYYHFISNQRICNMVPTLFLFQALVSYWNAINSGGPTSAASGYNSSITIASSQIDSCNPSFDVFVVSWGDNSMSIVRTGNGLAIGEITVASLCNLPFLSSSAAQGRYSLVLPKAGIKSSGNAITLYHEYKAPGTYDVSLADLYQYSTSFSITIKPHPAPTPPIPSQQANQFIIIQNGERSYQYIPINTTNQTLETYICRYAPIAIGSPSYSGQYGSIYLLSTQETLANVGVGILANDSSQSFLEQC